MESVGIAMMFDKKFFEGKKILVTGHTGFKGTWLCNLLVYLGANVCGYSLPLDSSEQNRLFLFSDLETKIKSIYGDIRDLDSLRKTFLKFEPEIVIHLAAQPIVRDSYLNPVYTYETNVIGTVNVCECVRLSRTVKSFLNVTTDKVYLNNEWEWGYRETDVLDGYDPYSNSKSCSELVTHSYINSFLSDLGIATSTARAGNVIGGGDFANDRIIPDCVRKTILKKMINIRNPYSIRPYQHVLEPLTAYLMIVEKQYKDKKYAGAYNIGPDEENCVSTAELVDLFCKYWEGAFWISLNEENAPHEANYLKLDCSKFKTTFMWTPCWGIEKAVQKSVDYYKSMLIYKKDIMLQQIEEFFGDMEIEDYEKCVGDRSKWIYRKLGC